MDQQKIVVDLEARARANGLTIGQACERAGLHPTTFSRWKRSERNPRPVGATLASIAKLREVIDAAAIAEVTALGADEAVETETAS